MKKITHLKSLSFLIAFLSVVSFGFGQQIASFSSLQNSACSGTIFLNSNITGTGICRSASTTESVGSTYNSRDWTTNTSLDVNDYLEWTVTPNSGYQIDFTNMNIRYDRSNTGPNMVDIQVDTGSGFSSIFTAASVSTSGENNTIDLSSLTGILGTVTFRLYAFYAGGTTGTFDIETHSATNRGVIINGTVSLAPPCPGLTTTWDGASWDNGVPDSTMPVILDGSYNTAINGGSFSACNLTINSSGTTPEYRLTVDNGYFVEVENDVVVDGELYVETQGNFVQNDNGGIFTVNPTGLTLVNKVTPAKQDWAYYTYWSSPVIGETIAGAFPNTDADRRFSFNANNYIDTNGDDVDDDGNDWTIEAGGNTMTPGVGYATTESQFHIPGSTGIASFTGSFNTGNIPTSIIFNALNITGSWNFIGNPYPSAIDFIAFQSANSTVVDGAAYFWSQFTPPDATNPGNQVSNFSQNDYATFTVGTGGAAGASGITPTRYIPSCQGFFIAGLSSGNATFTNAMRMADGTSNSQFFKSSNTKKSIAEANRLWVNLTSDNGVFNQILIGYVDGATSNNDGLLYDAPRLLSSDFASALYTEIDNSDKKFVIQGKATSSLNEDEIINLGFSTNIDVATLYTLSIAQLQGDFLTNNPIYLKDNLLNKVHDLTVCDYTFTSDVGEFNSRFEIAFSATALSIENAVLDSKSLRIIDLDNNRVQFNVSENLSIKTVNIYDLLGRQLYKLEGDSSSETYMLSNLNDAIYVAKVELSNGSIITKKAIKK